MKTLKVLIIITTLFLLFGCSEASFQEFDYIAYNGKKYELSKYWKPVGEQSKTKIQVNLLNYDSTVNQTRKYTAYGFDGDKDTVFLILDHRLFVQVDIEFVDLMDEMTQINKIEFVKLDSIIAKNVITDDTEFINLFMHEYRNKGTIFHKFDQNIKPQEFEVRIYPKDYFAYQYTIRIENDVQGDFGFRHDVEDAMLVCMFSKNLNEKFKELLR